MGITISQSEASRQTSLTREKRRMQRRDQAVSEILQQASHRYSHLDIKQNSHSEQGQFVNVGNDQKKSSNAENEENSNTKLEKVDYIKSKIANQEKKPQSQAIQSQNNNEQVITYQISHNQSILYNEAPSNSEEVVQNLLKPEEQVQIYTSTQQQRRDNHLHREVHTVDLKRLPVKTWRQNAERSSLKDGKEDLSIQLRQISLGLDAGKILNESGMHEYFKSQNKMPSMNLILHKKTIEQPKNSKQQNSLKNMRQAMKQIISGKINSSKMNYQNIHSFQAQRLSQKN